MLSAVLALVAQAVVVQRLAWPAWRLILVGLTALAVGTLLLAIGGHAVLLFAGVGCCGFGVGLCHPGCIGLASMSVGSHEQGSLAGLTSALPALGSIVGPLLGTGLYELSPHWAYGGNLLLLIAVIVYAYRQSQRVV
jgi:MFS family permease